jgi:hypothetical protein
MVARSVTRYESVFSPGLHQMPMHSAGLIPAPQISSARDSNIAQPRIRALRVGRTRVSRSVSLLFEYTPRFKQAANPIFILRARSRLSP